MFKNLFSFEGRIRRTEYGLSILITSFINVIAGAILGASGNPESTVVISFVLSIPLIWFMWAQGAKRCHDLGKSGWWQLIPFYGLWLLFQEGVAGSNQFGENPKGM